MLSVWQNQQQFQKHACISNVAAIMCPRFARTLVALQIQGSVTSQNLFLSRRTCFHGPGFAKNNNYRGNPDSPFSPLPSLPIPVSSTPKSSQLSSVWILCYAVADLLLKYEKSAIAVLPQLGECLQLVQDPKGTAAIVWMIGEYGQVWQFQVVLVITKLSKVIDPVRNYSKKDSKSTDWSACLVISRIF